MKPLRIGVVGGGPAGLYAALLLKKAHPAHAVQVLERNPAGATYGFGVVLSDRTLTSFREADQTTFDAITTNQATWQAIETYHRGVAVRCEGHAYAGIARRRLLAILQQRCSELGVELRFESDLHDLAGLVAMDLVIGADGVNSLVRSLHADAFKPTLVPGRSKYVWLGTEWVPSAFTFIFHETEHGLFQAHIYPYERQASTCVLMCREDTWRRSGLDRMNEAESLAFCERLLGPYTGGARFMSNRSLWNSFQTVRNERWSHGNAVLLGDAAHTAHWSIGSGTKLAMEDAIALAGALKEEPDLAGALARYEAERRPAVERLQEAGRVSERYCEEIERSMGLEPVPFAFQLMTRSRRLTYEGLGERDPAFVAAVDRCLASQTGVDAPREPVLLPLQLRGLLLPNRLVDGSEEAGLAMTDRLDPEFVAATRARGARAGFRLVGRPDLEQVRAAARLGFDLLEVGSLALEAVRAAWPMERPLAVRLGAEEPLPAVQACDLVVLESDDPVLGEQIKAAGVAVMLRAASRGAGNTLIAGGRADLCRLVP